ncbi:uncharacterized protein LOC132338715 [Haemorhous mexicanus]|uniref:uncharacterized protein LOC132338715 n=1 Tax=Haemorhous mexicanus TaxID=30427 RepID=UPI0028BE0EC7|nr:uncharacterized protein LOC132338715 [Haemorhous mexicanus]
MPRCWPWLFPLGTTLRRLPASCPGQGVPLALPALRRVCLKSLPPPSLPGEELLPLNWRMLQAPADEPEESCGKVKASREAACSCRVSPQLAAASPACCGRCHLQDREWPRGREVRGLRGAAGLSPQPRFNLQRAWPVLSPPGPGMLLLRGAGSGSAWAGRGHPGEGDTAAPPVWGQPGCRRRSGGWQQVPVRLGAHWAPRQVPAAERSWVVNDRALRAAPGPSACGCPPAAGRVAPSPGS